MLFLTFSPSDSVGAGIMFSGCPSIHPSVHSFIHTDIVTTISHEWLEQSWCNLYHVPDCSEVGIAEFRLVNRWSHELINYQFEFGPDCRSPISEIGTWKNELGNLDFWAGWNAALQLAPINDLVRFWRSPSKVKVTAGCRGGENMHFDSGASKSIF